MLPVIQIGPLAVQAPGLILLLGFWLGANLAEKHSLKHNLRPETLYNLVFTALIAGIVGGRLFYVARYLDTFLQSPKSIFSLNAALFDMSGALVSAFIAALIYGQKKALKFWATLDALTPFFAALAVAIGLSHFAAGTAFGTPTNLPWGIELWGAVRHPAQLYQTALAIGILILVWFQLQKPALKSGLMFLYFAAFTAAAHLFVEAFRGDSLTILDGFRSNQIAAWVILAAAFVLIEQRNRVEIQ